MLKIGGLGSQGIFGLDIGFETLKLCEIKKPGNKIRLIGMTEHPLTQRILEKDRIKDKAGVANIIKEACRKAKPHSIGARGIVTALPENFVFSKTIQVPKMSQRELTTAIPNEAAQYLPIPLSDVYIDFQTLITHPDESKIDVLIAAAPKKLVDDYVEMAKMANLTLLALETKPLAIGRAIIPNKSDQGILVFHIGTELTRISIWDRGEIRLSTTAPVGKNHLMRPFAIENPKITPDKIKIDQQNTEDIQMTIEPAIEEVLESIKYHHNRSHKPSKVTEIKLCGSGALIQGLDKIVFDMTKIKTRVAQPKCPTSQKIPPNYLTSLGLAMRIV